ncbi:MAG: hypothetical protein J5777_05955 [Clostridiales bacterium]|nr:hypothetical protein [Clostridiales bacterium]
MKKKSVILGAGAAAIFLLIIIICAAATSNPKSLVAGALRNTANDISGIEFIDYANRIMNGGSVTVSGSLKPVSGKDADAEIKVYTDISHTRAAVTGRITEGKDVKASFRSAFNGNDISFESPQVLKKAYGVSIKNLSANLPKSIFNPERTEEKIEIDKNLYKYLTRLSKTVADDKNLSLEGKKLARDYESRLVSALLDNARISKSSDKISAGGQQLNCTVVTLDFDRKALVDAVSEFVTYAKHDKKLEAYLLKVYANYDYGIKDADDMVDDFYAQLDSFKRSVKDYDGDMTVWIYITKAGKRIAKVDIDTDGRNSKGTRVSYEMSLELGNNVRNSEEIAFEFNASTGNSYDIRYSVRQNDRLAYKASLAYTVRAKSGKVRYASGLSFKWDKKAGGFTLTTENNDNIMSLEGNLTKKGDAYVFALENLETSGRYARTYKNISGSLADYNIRITVDRSDRAFSPARYTEITKMSYEDFTTLRSDTLKAYKEIYDTWLKKQ